jgi:hypothetical protein
MPGWTPRSQIGVPSMVPLRTASQPNTPVRQSAQPAYRVPRTAYCAHTGRSQIALYYQGAVYYGSRLDSQIRLWIVNRSGQFRDWL